ncbi:hypothetical protein [Streptomyces sp. SCA2-2]|uniref:hypothetical protein n=1 Tax=Streptomyces sp. SCA2-2 TaxID=1563677 RepID=UPI001021B9C5|nr:hypothetical protein [Streptomyces sp. SCA2-2]RZE89178.1 hypothetical protein C0L86_28930 [Streptomyces sp. SCA2-2]
MTAPQNGQFQSPEDGVPPGELYGEDSEAAAEVAREAFLADCFMFENSWQSPGFATALMDWRRGYAVVSWCKRLREKVMRS